ncbi:SDR family NAD(P)-dependent oxidoreductase [Streptomyces sp. A3M-1-3]|uniref:type I polyketide synthase n=1 Tax=Streptomyces sp. A3M-1-3 TaxID=2962044 RepID=UPI0020B7C448|nr:type I polyketide synthase [Streptomyces sp. A3M-1-3]MCP3821625.1 SDR family NAD(P)-dependent oxidoreductase [Streptomyces sp. A3M-1-3]
MDDRIPQLAPHTEQSLRRWLTDWLAAKLDIAPAEVGPTQPFQDLGLGSLSVVQLSGELEELLDREVPPTVVYRAPTVAALARHLIDPQAEPLPGPLLSPALGPEADAAEAPVAVIGLACRLPGGADSPDAYWRLLREGRDATASVPADRWSDTAAQGAHAREVLDRTPARGGFLTEDLAAFDAEFFGLSDREAAAVDPQQRLMLEVAWEALEHAGIPPRSLAGSAAGVFVGASASDYGSLQMNDLASVDAWSGTGSALSVIANRISYTLGLTGPSMVVDTACSSSLVAVHLAMRSLRARESSVALAGGVNLLLSPAVTVNFEDAGVMAADGRSKTFAAGADGYGRGEGCGFVVLKRLDRALRDGDPVLAVLRGSAVNQDGASNGLMAPSPRAQERLIRAALDSAGVTADSLDYVEAHGTGTELGDPVEVEGIAAALLGTGTARGSDLLIGSVKTNIGHLEAAAGIASLIKVVLSLVHGALPPSLHFDEPNPHIPFDRLPLRVVTEVTGWKRGDRQRRAGVSGFGFGGTNAHLILEEAPAPAQDARPAAVPGPLLVPLSAGSAEALRAQARRMGNWLRTHPDVPAADVAHTLALRRSHESHRIAVVADSTRTLAARFSAFAAGTAVPGLAEGTTEAGGEQDGPVWVFSGQGSQWAGMGRELLRKESAFARCVDELEPLVAAEGGFSLREVLNSSDVPTRVDVVQPVLFAMQVGLAAVLRSRGVRPGAVIGHSMGEVAAAVVCGALRLPDAVQVVCRRSRLLTRVAGQGAMAVVEADLERARALAAGAGAGVEVAVVPSPRSVVVSGDPGAIRRLVEECQRQEVNARTVQVDVASHSPQMDVLLGPLREALRELTPRAAELPFLSTVGGREDRAPACDADYWADNLRAPVLLADAVRAAEAAGFRVFQEVSPHPVLIRDIATTLDEGAPSRARVVATLRRDTDPGAALASALGALHCHGVRLPWERLVPAGGLTDLPRLAWHRRRHWTRSGAAAAPAPETRPADPAALPATAPLPGTATALGALPGAWLWETELRGRGHDALYQHRVGGRPLLPLSAPLLIALRAAERAGSAEQTEHAVRDLTVHAPVVLDEAAEAAAPALQTLLRAGDAADPAPARLDLHSRTGRAAWTRCASARLHPDPDPLGAGPGPEPAAAVGDMERIDVSGHYARLASGGLEYGPRLRTLRRLWRSGATAIGEALPAEPDRADPLLLFLEAGFQTLTACLPDSGAAGAEPGGFLVTGADGFRMPRAAAEPGTDGPLYVRARLEEDGDGAFTAALDWYRAGRRVAAAHGVRVRRAGGAPAGVPGSWAHALRWRLEPLADPDAPVGGPVLVVADGAGVGEALARRLRATGVPCRTVAAADLDGLAESPLRTALGDLAEVRHLVYCAGLDTGPAQGTDPARAVRLASSAVRLIRVLLAEPDTRARLWLATGRAQAVAREGGLSPAQAQLWGLGRCLALEDPERFGGLVDLDDPADPEACAAALLAELGSAPAGGQSAYRAAVRHVPRLVRTPLPAPVVRPVDPEGAHLVVGATGRIGPLLLERLIHLGARHLVLVSRRGIPEETADALRAQGVGVTGVAADVADEEAMGELFARFGDGLPPLRGIYHAAFAEDVAPLAELDDARLESVLRAKVAGTALLHRLSAGHEVAEFLCYSSTTALLGSQGLAHYAAANCFQDTLVHLRSERGEAAHTVNWGTWSDGLAGTAVTEAITASGLRLMDGARAVRALDHVLGCSAAQVVVADADWPVLAAAYATRTPVPLLADLEDAAGEGAGGPGDLSGPAGPFSGPEPVASRLPEPLPAAELRERLSAAGDEERQRLLHRYVHETVASVLGLSSRRALDPADRFWDLGMDSLLTMTLVRRLKAVVPGLRPQALRDNPTVAGLTEALMDLLDPAT